MMVMIEDLYMQKLSRDANNFSEILFSMKNFEIVDILLRVEWILRLEDSEPVEFFETNTKEGANAPKSNPRET